MTRRRAGFSMVELVVVLSVLALLFSVLGMILGTSMDAYQSGSLDRDVEARGAQLLRRIVDSARSADAGAAALIPASPLSAAALDFQQRTAFDGTRSGLGPPVRIDLDPALGVVRRTENVGLPGERTIVLARGVPDLLEGEVLNGLDDNGNGLVDEPGFCLSREGSVLHIRLTLRSVGARGRTLMRTWETSLQCRN